ARIASITLARSRSSKYARCAGVGVGAPAPASASAAADPVTSSPSGATLAIPALQIVRPSATIVSSTLSGDDQPSGSRGLDESVSERRLTMDLRELGAEGVEVVHRALKHCAHAWHHPGLSDEVVDVLERFFDVSLVDLDVLVDHGHRRAR